MTPFLGVSLVLKMSRPAKEITKYLIKTHVICDFRMLSTSKAPVQYFLNNRSNINGRVYAALKQNIRCMSEVPVEKPKEKPQDRFIPKNPLAGKNLWKPVIITLVIGGVCTAYMLYLKDLKNKEIEKERNRSIGKSLIGGKFELVDKNNKVRTSEDFLGKWLLIYFGFTHCPDICPDEIEKMVQVVDLLGKEKNLPEVVPIFISVDPVRDTPSVVGGYVAEFSDKIIGLTGSEQQIKDVCKAYRVYYSPGPKDKDSDYIVDHSIIMYLVNPKGEFMDYYGQNSDSKKIASGIILNMSKYGITNNESFIKRLFS